MDYGKFLYQQEKKEREAKKHQKTITVKEVKFRINVDEHDYQTKKNHVLRFLDEGDKVKATIFFRGREMTRTGLGREILERLIKDVDQKGIVEFRPPGREHPAFDPGAEEGCRAEAAAESITAGATADAAHESSVIKTAFSSWHLALGVRAGA